MNVSTIKAEIHSLNEQLQEAIKIKTSSKSLLLSTCTELDAMVGNSTIKSVFLSTIDGVMPKINAKTHELAALKKQ